MRRGTLADNHDVLNNPITDDKKMLAKILINHFLIAFFFVVASRLTHKLNFFDTQ